MVEHKLIEESLLAFKKVMEKNKIPFWLEYGTQLGAVRDGKIIEWDLDGDVGVWLKDIRRMKDAEEDFKAAGIYLAYQPSHIYINLLMPDKTWRMTVDVYTFDTKKEKDSIPKKHVTRYYIVRIENGKLKDVRSPYIYYRMFKEIDFLGTKFPVPINVESALEFAYGKEWRTPIKKAGLSIQIGNPTREQLNKGGRTHHLKLEEL